MLELKGEEKSIWRSLRQGSLGTVLWALQRDRQVQIEFKRALESVDCPKRFGAALQPTGHAVANSIGQLALHQLAADASSIPHIEPRDNRWSLFRPMPDGLLEELCVSVASNPGFREHARKALSHAVDAIRKTPGDSDEGKGGEEVAELERMFLIQFGIGFGEILERRDEEFVRLVGAIAELNQNVESSLFPFSKTGRKRNSGEEF